MKKIFKIFISLSALAFWYKITPPMYWVFILKSILIVGISLPFIVVQFYIQMAIVNKLRKRYKWARKLFINPRTM